jgi:hypothetical protein
MNASIIRRTFTSAQTTGIKNPTKLTRLPRKNHTWILVVLQHDAEQPQRTTQKEMEGVQN